MAMDDGADVLDALFENPVGRRVGNHQCGQPFAVGDSLRLEIGDVDAAVCRARHDHNAHAGHDRARRVRAVRRRWNEYHVPVRRASGQVVRPNDHQPSEFALCA